MKKIITKLSNGLILVVIIALAIISTFLNVCKNQEELISTEFLVNYLGVFVGIVLTLVTFIYSVIVGSNIDGPETRMIFKELKDNTYFVFWMFVLSIGIMGVGRIDFLLIGIENYVYIRFLVMDFLKNSMFFLSIYAMYDVIGCMFKVMY